MENLHILMEAVESHDQLSCTGMGLKKIPYLCINLYISKKLELKIGSSADNAV